MYIHTYLFAGVVSVFFVILYAQIYFDLIFDYSYFFSAAAAEVFFFIFCWLISFFFIFKRSFKQKRRKTLPGWGSKK